VVIVQLLDNKAKDVYVIMRDEIKSVEIVSDSESFVSNTDNSITKTDFDRLFETEVNLYSLTQPNEFMIEKRKNALIMWLQKNHLPAILSSKDEINILDTVYIKPPYDLNSCLSINEIILDKVRNLIEKFDTESK
jgi:hypothetical protein